MEPYEKKKKKKRSREVIFEVQIHDPIQPLIIGTYLAHIAKLLRTAVLANDPSIFCTRSSSDPEVAHLQNPKDFCNFFPSGED